MITQTTQYLDGAGLLISEYADKLLDMIQPPPNGKVSVIILAHDGYEIMKAHFNPLSAAQMLNTENWWSRADVHADTYASQFDSIIEAARRRWPLVRIFRVPGCLCCNGIDNLLEYDCEC